MPLKHSARERANVSRVHTTAPAEPAQHLLAVQTQLPPGSGRPSVMTHSAGLPRLLLAKRRPS